MKWQIIITPSALDDLQWFGPKNARVVLNEAAARIEANPLEESKNMKRCARTRKASASFVYSENIACYLMWTRNGNR